MALNEFKIINGSSIIEPVSSSDDEEFGIPLSISDIINICRDFNQLGWQVQNRIEYILENGIEDSINEGYIKIESLPHIKYFLQQISRSPFGDGSLEAEECLALIFMYEEKHNINYRPQSN